MRIVLDTNVLVSGLLSPYGTPANIVRLCLAGRLTLCVDARIQVEYAQVLARPKFGLDVRHVGALMDFVAAEAVQALARPIEVQLTDPDDEVFLEVAIAANADALVTGNIAHFPEGARTGMNVVTPAKFLASVRGG